MVHIEAFLCRISGLEAKIRILAHGKCVENLNERLFSLGAEIHACRTYLLSRKCEQERWSMAFTLALEGNFQLDFGVRSVRHVSYETRKVQD